MFFIINTTKHQGRAYLGKNKKDMKKTIFERFFITPGIKCLSIAICLTAGLLTSCSDDDDNNGDDDDNPPHQEITLDTPKYESVSAKYEITSGGGGISSIELTASGNYVVTMYGAAGVPSSLQQRNMMKSMLFAADATRANDGYITGKFVKISDTEFILEGFGSIVIDGAADNAFSIQVTPSEGATYTMNAEKAATVSNSEMTKALCRTWNINTVTIKGTFNGRDFYNGETPASQYVQNWDGLNKAFNQMIESITGEPENEPLYEPELTPAQIIFTRSGSYMVITDDNRLAVYEWEWKNEAAGTINYSNDIGSNSVSILFGGKELTMTEVNMDIDESEEGERFQMKIQSSFKCTEMK